MRDFLSEVRNYSLWILERMTGQGEGFCTRFLLLFLIIFAVIVLKLKRSGAVWVTAASWLFEAVFSVLVYQLHLWHFISLCFVLIWTVWVLYEQKRERRPADKITGLALGGAQGLLIILSACMFLNWNSQEETSSLDNALHGLYSDGVNAAEFIDENISPEELIVSANVSMASTVLAYLPDYQFYFAGTGEITFYADYSERQSSQVSYEELRAWARENFPEREEFYLLDTGDSCIIDRDRLEECEVLYRTEQETARGEEYTLYCVLL